jgi:class 3 adenylate cyclase/pimeloyl-ACP methyl ester carboxylesterase
LTGEPPEVRYAKSGNVHIAYQVFGNGPTNLVFAPGLITHLNYYWKYHGMVRFLEGLAKFSRVAAFDKRGTGLSDREAGIPTFEERMDDIRAVMDAAGFDKAVLFGASEGAAMSMLFAATYPSRTIALIIYGGHAKGSWSPDYPWEYTKEQYQADWELHERTWGTKEQLQRTIRALGDEEFAKWFNEMSLAGGSPGAYIALQKSYINMDVRPILPAIHVPTLVIHRVGDQIGGGRYIASHIQGAKLVELPGDNHFFFREPEIVDRIVDEVKKFITELKPIANVERMLTTVLFTDIVSSTKKVIEEGDARWQALLEQHNSMVERELKTFSGVLVKNTGDGILATFDGPTRAIRCALAIVKSAREIGLEIRAGLHTGECVLTQTDVSGIAVHIAHRIMEKAEGGEVLVSETVKDLVYGSGIAFADKGFHRLKGIEDRKRLYSVVN